MDNKSNIVAVTALVKNREWDKFLILKRNQDEIAYPWKWAFPGWKLEPWEVLMETLKREVLEEVWLEIENYKEYLWDFTFMRKDWHNVVWITFMVTAKNEDVILDKEFEWHEWIFPQELDKYDYIPWMDKEVKQAFSK